MKNADFSEFLYQVFKIGITWRTIQHTNEQTGDVFQGAEAHNCGFMAALAAIADHEDGYLVRLLLQHSIEHDELKPGRTKGYERNKSKSFPTDLQHRATTLLLSLPRTIIHLVIFVPFPERILVSRDMHANP